MGAALASFAVAGLAGLALAALSSWWLVAVGAACIAAAWTYTGGPLPYGYRALGEVFVFVFFGLVAVVGTTDRKSTRLNSSHANISYAVFCLKKKKKSRRSLAAATARKAWASMGSVVHRCHDVHRRTWCRCMPRRHFPA